jgi:alkanesulfonate monooxygenase SsuD/methylene tetrahydromethanopterin reductase-like flavin-dependent oxidoreductase (luciferase family)
MTSIRFGLPGGRGELNAASPDSKLVQAAAADDLGYDCLWLSERHLAPPGGTPRYGPSPLVLAGAVAARTRRIGIGLSPLLIQLHDPVRLAEDIATLDGLSGGRVLLGLGQAAPPLTEALRNGQPMPTARRALDVLLGLWAGRPNPPLLVAANDARDANWAAELGYPVIAPAMLGRARLARFLADFANLGGMVAESPVERFCLVAETDAEAREIALPLAERITDRYARGLSPEPPGLADGDDLDPERFCERTALVGSPDTVAARIAELRDECGITRINLRPSLTGQCPLSQQRVTVALFAAEVMPRFRPDLTSQTGTSA